MSSILNFFLMAVPTQYPLFEHWYKTTNWILDRCERMPRDVRFTVSQRISDLSLQVTEHIIEAIYRKDKLASLQSINMCLEKLRLFFRLCHDRKYISINQFEFISRAINEAGKMCGGWLKKIQQK